MPKSTHVAACECCGSTSKAIYWHGILRCALCGGCRRTRPAVFDLARLRQIQAGQTARAVTRTLMAAAS